MKGVLLISHGRLAEGMYDSATMFLGEDVEQLDFLCLLKEDNPMDFGDRVKNKIIELDSGDGVVVVADLLGGTPNNQTVPLISEKVDLITGMNFPMILELLSKRIYDTNLDLNDFICAGKEGIVDVKSFNAVTTLDDDE